MPYAMHMNVNSCTANFACYLVTAWEFALHRIPYSVCSVSIISKHGDWNVVC